MQKMCGKFECVVGKLKIGEIVGNIHHKRKMIFQVLLILPLYVGIFALFFRFRRIIKAMTEIDEMIFTNCSLEEETTQEEGDTSKREFLIAQVERGKADKLPGKTPWTVNRLRKATDQVIEKLYHEYQQTDARHKAETTGKAVSAHVVNMYSKSVSRVLKIDSVEQLRRDIDNDPIIKESMADVGALMVGTFGRFLAPLLIAAHTANHTEGFVQRDGGTINENERQTSGNLLPAGEPLEGAGGDNRAS